MFPPSLREQQKKKRKKGGRRLARTPRGRGDAKEKGRKDVQAAVLVVFSPLAGKQKEKKVEKTTDGPYANQGSDPEKEKQGASKAPPPASVRGGKKGK